MSYFYHKFGNNLHIGKCTYIYRHTTSTPTQSCIHPHKHVHPHYICLHTGRTGAHTCTCPCLHTQMHIDTPIHQRPPQHTHTPVRRHMCEHAYKCTYSKHKPRHMGTCAQRCYTFAHMHSLIREHICAHSHRPMHTQTYTYTRSMLHVLILLVDLFTIIRLSVQLQELECLCTVYCVSSS